MKRYGLIAPIVLGVALAYAPSILAGNFTGMSGNWDVATNWNDGMVPSGSLGGADATINRADNVTVTVNSTVPAFDQFQTVNTTTATPNTITLMVENGADVQMNNYSRLGRGGNTNGDTSQLIMTGGSFQQVANDFHLGWDVPAPSNIYLEVSGGTFDVFDELRLGQATMGNVNPNDATDMITAPDKLEFHVKGSGATIRVGELHFESNLAAVDPWAPTMRFSLDQNGTSTVVVDGQGDTANGRITFEDSSILALNVLSANVPGSVSLVTSVVANQGQFHRADGTPINAGDQVSAGAFGGQEYLYNVYYDSTYDGLGTPGVYLTNLQTMPAQGLAGDYNGDHQVDAADYTVWRDNLGALNEDSLHGNGDGANGVDANDYTRWKNNFGMSGGSGAVAVGAPVPEPATLLLLLAAACGATILVRFRR